MRLILTAGLLSGLLLGCAAPLPRTTPTHAPFPVSPSPQSTDLAGLPAPLPCPGCWHPALVTSWQWQLSSVPTPSFLPVTMYDIDGFETPASTVAALHASLLGRRVTCYLSAGSWEQWRPDAASFPSALLGKPLRDWPGERWLDIRDHRGTLAAIMAARLDMCRAKGFDAVEFDNVDAYRADSGFPLTSADQLGYNAWLAGEAHRRGLSVALKNDLAQIPQLLAHFDWALNEQCWQFQECLSTPSGIPGLDQFVAAGKAVMTVEYDLQPADFCQRSNDANFNSLYKHLKLDDFRVPCRGA